MGRRCLSSELTDDVANVQDGVTHDDEADSAMVEFVAERENGLYTG
jgi:hypothetical protein